MHVYTHTFNFSLGHSFKTAVQTPWLADGFSHGAQLWQIGDPGQETRLGRPCRLRADLGDYRTRNTGHRKLYKWHISVCVKGKD